MKQLVLVCTAELKSNNVHLSPQVKTEVRREVLSTFLSLTWPYVCGSQEDSLAEQFKIQGAQMTYAKFKPTLHGLKILQ